MVPQLHSRKNKEVIYKHLETEIAIAKHQRISESLDCRKFRTSEASVFFHPDVRLLAAHAELLYKTMQLGH